MHRRPHAQDVQAELQVALYGVLRKGGGRVSTALLAEEMDVVPSTVSRQSTGEMPVQAQTLAAVHKLDEGAGLRLLRILAGAMGQDTRPAVRLASSPTLHQALQAIADAAVCCSEATALQYASLHDARLEPRELVELQTKWAEEDEARQQMRDKLEAMVPSERGGGQLGRLKAVGAK